MIDKAKSVTDQLRTHAFRTLSGSSSGADGWTSWPFLNSTSAAPWYGRSGEKPESRAWHESLLLGTLSPFALVNDRRTASLTIRRAPRVVDLEGVRLHALDEEQCVSMVMDASLAGRGGWIVTPNLDHMRRLVGDESLRARYNRADLAVADGMPLVWACRLQNTPLPARVSGSDLIVSLSRAAAEKGRSVFFLGGDPGTAEAAARELCARFDNLRVAGACCPAPGFENRPDEMEALTAHLAEARPDVIFVALGSPKQELLIERLRSRVPAAWWMGVGISFSFVAGHVKRAPVWLRNIGCEWLHRMAQEPRRLVRRYLLDGVPFGLALIVRSTLRGLRTRALPSESTAGAGNHLPRAIGRTT